MKSHPETPEELLARAKIIEVHKAWPGKSEQANNDNPAEKPPKRKKVERAPREGWRASSIVDDRGRIVANLADAMIALRADPSIEGAVAFDEMAQATKLEKRLPLAPNGKHAGTDPVPRLARDEDVSQLQEWLQHQGMPRIVKDTVQQAVNQRARECFFHPVREWLANLRWDGTERLTGWLQTYLGATGPQDCHHRSHVPHRDGGKGF
jgi:predicted P-loop ATPase